LKREGTTSQKKRNVDSVSKEENTVVAVRTTIVEIASSRRTLAPVVTLFIIKVESLSKWKNHLL
jgi:hypothetical protein